MRYAIGDIHGHAAALTALFAAIHPQPDDTLVFLGDYVDRGPDSRGVLQQFIDTLEIPADAKAVLKAMTPASYTGNAARQAADI